MGIPKHKDLINLTEDEEYTFRKAIKKIKIEIQKLIYFKRVKSFKILAR